MSTFLQLWDATTGNLVREFDSEDEAIEYVLGILSEDGDQPILEFALFRFEDGRPTLVAKERDLIDVLARAQTRSLTTATGS